MSLDNTSFASLLDEYIRLKTVIDDTESAYMGFSFFYIVLGSLLNLWYLAALLTHPELRQSMRNKIICNMLLVNLTDTLLRIPVFFVIMAHKKVNPNNKVSCVVFSALANATLIQDFIANWLLVIILILFLNYTIGCCGVTKVLNPLAVKVATVVVLLLPWVCSLVLIPGVMHDYHRKRPNITGSEKFCLYPTREALPVFKSLDTAVPLFLSIILVSATAVVSHIRNTGSAPSGSMERQLIGSKPEDKVMPYVIAVIISCFCEISLVLTCFEALFPDGVQGFQMIYASYVLSDSRTLLMPLPWLLFPEIRERIKAWRPKTSSSPSDNDATVQH